MALMTIFRPTVSLYFACKINGACTGNSENFNDGLDETTHPFLPLIRLITTFTIISRSSGLLSTIIKVNATNALSAMRFSPGFHPIPDGYHHIQIEILHLVCLAICGVVLLIRYITDDKGCAERKSTRQPHRFRKGVFRPGKHPSTSNDHRGRK